MMEQGHPSKELERAQKTVFRLLKFRPRSEKEIVDKLRDKEIPKDTIEEAVRYFKKTGIIDDQLFARAWITSRLRKPVGLRRIRLELKQKGISPEILNEECQRAAEGYEEFEVLLSLAQRRMEKYRHIPRLKAKRRLYDYLARRGFNNETIQKVVREI